jgi:aspartyl-tRNA(Asn)/glutamyl-tRNA(Gln) amidotransferase subunit A
MDSQIYYLGVAEMSKLIASRQLSPVELLETFLHRIETIDKDINSYLLVTRDEALKQARYMEAELSAGRTRGPLHGIPYALKDAYATAGIPTTGNSKLFKNNVPGEDASIVRKLNDAGGVLLGKLATYELTYGGAAADTPWPLARNPWDKDRDTGGSSSGSAAAVAAGLCMVALGTDTGGSIRKPASLCGIVGLKPTYGLVSRHGVMENSYSLDTCGPMTRSVEDAAIVLEVIAGRDARDPTTVDRPVGHYVKALRSGIKATRVGVVRTFYERDLPADDEICSGMDEALRTLKQLGALITDIELPPLPQYAECKVTIQRPEIYSVYRKYLMTQPEDFGSKFLHRIRPAVNISAIDYFEAQQLRRQLTADIMIAMEDVDVLVTPGFYGPAPLLNETVSDFEFSKLDVCVPFSIARMPAISLCNGYTSNGLPLAIQFVGRPFDEESVLRVAYAYEQATSWHTRHPIP